MIIFGTRGVTRTKDRGTFHCPSCGTPQPFKEKTVRRFFTLYFIPVIPLDRVGEYIECDKCKQSFRTEVLNYTPRPGSAPFEAEFQRAMKRVMIHMMMADGDMDDSEVERVGAIYQRLAGQPLSQDEFLAEAQQAHGRSGEMLDELKRISGSLNDQGKEMVVKSALFIAAADGVIENEETELLQQIAESVQMTSAHFRGVMAEGASLASASA